MDIELFLAAVSGKSVINAVLWVIGLGLICWLLWWLIDYVGLPQPFSKVAKVIVAVAAVIVLINLIISIMGGEPFIRW